MELISLFFLLIYSSLVLIMIYGWNKPAMKESPDNIKVTVSVIVAFRNEQKHFPGLIKNLYLQDYPQDQIEIIFINDHSSDLSLKMIQEHDKQHLVQVLELSKNQQGKKQAIAKGIAHAKGDLILLTDADCSFSASWIRSMVDAWKTTNSKLILGPVRYSSPKNIAQHLFNLDFMSLTGAGAALANAGQPIMGNAANLLVQRECFPKTGDALMPSESSGDDVFLIHHLKKQGASSISFLKDPGCIVDTESPMNIKEFIQQRIRWASKSKNYRDTQSILVAAVIFLFNSYLLIMPFFILFQGKSFLWLVLLLGTKSLLDFFFLYPIARFYGHQKSLLWLIPANLLYPFYIVFTAFRAWWGRFSWKDRQYP